MVVMGFISMNLMTDITFLERNGICFSAPDTWMPCSMASCIVNMSLLLVSALSLIMLNARYNFMPHSSHLSAALFLLLVSASPVIIGRLNSSSILVLINIFALALLFSAGQLKSYAPAIFLIASTLSIGSMVQYAFIFFIPIYAFANVILNGFHWKDLGALILGTLAPYWIILGTGLVSPSDLQLPQMQFIQIPQSEQTEFFIFLITILITVLWSIIALLSNSIGIISAGTATRKYFNTLTVPLIASMILMAIDYSNISVYAATFFLFAAIQAGYIKALSRNGKTWAIFSVALIIYISLFIIFLIYD
jgi:hypothetical protein